MAGPILVIDSDHRFQEVTRLAQGSVFTLDDAAPAGGFPDAERIASELRTNMDGAGIKTIVVDSLTAIMSPLITAAVMDNDAGRNRNKVAACKGKAMAMRLLQATITDWGTDTLWVYHTRTGLDGQARQVASTSINAVELARLRRSHNMVLRVHVAQGHRSVSVEWARKGRSGLRLEDTTSSGEACPHAWKWPSMTG